VSDEQAKCELCGEPMPAGEEMFKFHGYSGACPKPPLQVLHHFDTEHRIFTSAETAAAFYANLAKQHETDRAMKETFQASCETAEMLLDLHRLRTAEVLHREAVEDLTK
jgi:hypothetical protein